MKSLDAPIHIIDDDEPFRAAISRLLRLHGYIVKEHPSADAFLENTSDGVHSGCILLDVKLPGLSGPELQERMAHEGTSFVIIFLTGFGDVPTTVRAIKAGAEDVLTKPVSEQDLLQAIKRALARLQLGQAKQEWLRTARTKLETLSPRERHVFEHVVRGRLNKQIGYDLGITERTIKAHRQRIFEKLGVRTVADLVSLAERTGVLDKSGIST